MVHVWNAGPGDHHLSRWRAWRILQDESKRDNDKAFAGICVVKRYGIEKGEHESRGGRRSS